MKLQLVMLLVMEVKATLETNEDTSFMDVDICAPMLMSSAQYFGLKVQYMDSHIQPTCMSSV